MKIIFLLLTALILPLAGCTSIGTHVDKDRHLAAGTHFFVLSNLNDSHDLDTLIARTLRAHGFDAESGPLTMMPADTQVIIGYEDHWTWDFSNHMIYLRLSARDPQVDAPFASAVYQKNVAFNTDADAVVGQLIDALLKSVR